MDLPFSDQEYEERLKKVRNQMAHQELDAIVVTGAENIYYMSGFRAAMMGAISPLTAIVLPIEAEPALIARSLEVRAAHDQWMKKLALYMDHVDPYRILAGLLRECGAEAGRVGIEETNLTLWRFKKMREVLPKATFKDASGIIRGLMARLSKKEVDYMKKAAAITNRAFQAGIDAIREGVSSYEVVGEINHVMYKAGQTDSNAGRAWCWAGPGGGQIHSSALDYRIRKGDLVTIELGSVYHMYRVNAQGTVYVGDRPSETIVKAYKMVSEMYQRARNAVRPGAKAEEIYDGSNTVYRREMGADYFRRVGGSMGLAPYAISLSKGNQQVLDPGFALVIQPLVNEPVLVTCCSTILVTETGREELTTPLLELRIV